MSHRFVARSSMGSALPGARGPAIASCSGGSSASGGLLPGGSRARVHGAKGGSVDCGSPTGSALQVRSSPGSRSCAPSPGDCDESLPSSKRARFQVPIDCLPPTPAESRLSLEVSKAISAFARYPHRRPAGLLPSDDGSLNIHDIWNLWGRFHGVSKHNMLQFIAEHAFHTAGHRDSCYAAIARDRPG